MLFSRITDKRRNPSDRDMKTRNENQTTALEEKDLEERITKDGSRTIVRKASGLMYRSSQGALEESSLVFVEGSGLLQKKQQWNVFEFGFGTGMNFNTTYRYAVQEKIELHYEAVDHMPVPSKFASCSWSAKILERVRSTNTPFTMKTPIGTMTLHPCSFEKASINICADAIFHDPFGPSDNPEGWSELCFKKEASILSDTGIWTSYGASGAMRRALAKTGFFVAVGPPIGKKRETTRASKSSSSVQHLKIKYRPPKD